jgi:hypothetical protein
VGMEGLFGGGEVVAIRSGRATLLVGVHTVHQWGAYEKGGAGRGVRGCLPGGVWVGSGRGVAHPAVESASSYTVEGGAQFEAKSTHFELQDLVHLYGAWRGASGVLDPCVYRQCWGSIYCGQGVHENLALECVGHSAMDGLPTVRSGSEYTVSMWGQHRCVRGGWVESGGRCVRLPT